MRSRGILPVVVGSGRITADPDHLQPGLWLKASKKFRIQNYSYKLYIFNAHKLSPWFNGRMYFVSMRALPCSIPEIVKRRKMGIKRRL